MKVTFLYHSAFLLEDGEALYLFDCYKGLPSSLPEGKPLYVFASHRHQDHFSEKIFDLEKLPRETYFILSDDIWKKRVPEDVLGQTTFVKPHQRYKIGRISVETLKSTDEGVAFLIFAGRKTYYHAGDLNDWYWEGEPKAWNRNMEVNYQKEVDLFKDWYLDVAFVVLDGRQGKDYARGMDYFLENGKPAHVFPMHCWGDFSVIARYQEERPGLVSKTRFHEVQKEGQTFQI